MGRPERVLDCVADLKLDRGPVVGEMSNPRVLAAAYPTGQGFEGVILTDCGGLVRVANLVVQQIDSFGVLVLRHGGSQQEGWEIETSDGLGEAVILNAVVFYPCDADHDDQLSESESEIEADGPVILLDLKFAAVKILLRPCWVWQGYGLVWTFSVLAHRRAGSGCEVFCSMGVKGMHGVEHGC